MNLQSEKNLPEGMTIERKLGEIAIEIFDIPLRTVRLLMLWGNPLLWIVIIPGILAYVFMSGQIEIGQTDKFIRELPIMIGVYLTLASIALYFSSIRGRNKTKITKRSGKIEILYGPIPVPWRPRARSFRVDQIAQIDHVDEARKNVTLRNISLVLRDSTKFSVGRWPIPVADAVMQ